MMHSRRDQLAAAAGTVFASILLPLRAAAIPQLRVTGIELLPVRATSRTVWLLVRLRTDAGLEGLGEASDAFGFANTPAADTARMRTQLAVFFNLIDGRSPFEIESYRQRGEAMARQGLVAAATWSAERLLAVFVHEMAHIRRRDWALHTRTKSTCVTKPP